jgi:hypothetical protein
MDDYGVSPLMMLRLLSPLLVIGPIVLWFLIAGPFVLYLVARWRAHREPVVDPQLGLKTALNYFGMIGFQLALFGAMMIVWMIVTKEASGDRGAFLRVAFGFLIPALIVYGVHHMLLKRTNQREFMGVTRLFQGYNLLVTGLVGVTSFFLVFQALFSKGSSGEMGRISAAMLVVYGSAWAVCGLQFARTVLDTSYEPPRDTGTPPSVVAPQPPATGGHTLPSLGGGSFPPIAPK